LIQRYVRRFCRNIVQSHVKSRLYAPITRQHFVHFLNTFGNRQRICAFAVFKGTPQYFCQKLPRREARALRFARNSAVRIALAEADYARVGRDFHGNAFCIRYRLNRDDKRLGQRHIEFKKFYFLDSHL
jgi:hypothetical protein